MIEGLSYSVVSQLQFARVYMYPPLPLVGASLILQPKPQGLRLFIIHHPYISLLLLTLLLFAAAAAALVCCCCCGYLLTLPREEENNSNPQLDGGPPTLFQGPHTGPPDPTLIGSIEGVSTPQANAYIWGVRADAAANNVRRRASATT